MADLTVSVACLPLKQKSELCSGSNLPQSQTQNICNGTNSGCCNSISSNHILSENPVVGLPVYSCSAVCKNVDGNTKQYYGNLQPETEFTFSKDVKVESESQNVNSIEFDDDDHCSHSQFHNKCSAGVSQICHAHKHAPTIKLKGFDKCNGLTHHHHTEIHSFNKDKDSDRESESTYHCTTKVDSDYVSCDEIETVNICSPQVCCHNDNCGVSALLTDLEKTSIRQLSYSSEPFTFTVSDDVINGVTYIVYESEKQMPDIMRLITKDLSEPYSIYTYRYFIHNWPKLCFLALCDTNCVGAIVCKLDLHKKMVRRGYIAMLAVDSEYRRRKIGSILVTKAIEAMIRDDCDEVVLETEITNQSALRLYENLGFVRDKRLFRYYLNGVDALRLKLWLR